MAIGGIPKEVQPNEAKKEEVATKEVEKEVEVKEPVVQEDIDVNSDDFMTKITELVGADPEKSAEQKVSEVYDDIEFRKKIDSLKETNPELAEQMELMRKSAISGVNQKFQEIAEMRKEIEAFKATANKPKYSANSVDELLSNPDFLKDAQAYAQTQETSLIDGDEYLSDETKTYIKQLEDKVKKIEQVAEENRRKEEAQKAQQYQKAWSDQHEVLSKKYRNYDKDLIDQTAKQLANNELNVTPEYLYKVIKHDENVRMAYEKGKKEGASLFQAKKEVNSNFEGISPMKLEGVSQEKGEDNASFFRRISSTLAGS